MGLPSGHQGTHRDLPIENSDLMGFYGDFNGINVTYPLVNIQKAIENTPVNSYAIMMV